MKQFLITVAGVLVGLVLFLIIAPLVILGQISSALRQTFDGAEPEKAAVVLSLDLRGGLNDQPTQSFFASAFGNDISTMDIVRKLEAASSDARVKGLYVRAPARGMNAAAAEEVRGAFQAFQKSGKFVVAHLQNEGDVQSVAGLAVVAGANEVWLDPGATLPPIGFSVTRTYLADTLKRFSIDATIEAREEYKSAASGFTNSSMSKPERENIDSLYGDIYARMVEVIAEDRKLSADDVKAAIAASPLTAEDAVKRNLVSKMGRPYEAAQAAIDLAGGEKAAELYALADYRAARQPREGAAIAVIAAEGAIEVGDDGRASPFDDSETITAGVVARQIRSAAKNPDVKAIVLRINSPGGSALASDQIGHAIDTAQADGKKVVVSMGPVAASGGYWVAAGADEIFAHPSTITGSIGVVYGSVSIGRALEKNLSIRSESVTFGSPLVAAANGNRAPTDNERKYLGDAVQRVYDRFLARVKDGRGFATVEDARAVAKGRVWTGRQAMERRLVDRMGGLNAAIARAGELAGLKADAKPRLIFYPERPRGLEALSQFFGASTQTAKTFGLMAAFINDADIDAALDGLVVRQRQRGMRAESEAYALQ